MKRWTARLELDARAADLGGLGKALSDYHPSVAPSHPGHRPTVEITVVGENLRQAVITAVAVTIEATGSDIRAVEIAPADEFGRRRSLRHVPDLLSVTEAAAELSVSPQAIRQRLDAGTIAGTKIGSTWAVPRAEVSRLKEA